MQLPVSLQLKAASNDAAVKRLDPKNQISTLSRLVLNVIDACNRSCVFCPRSIPLEFPNHPKNRMTIQDATILADRMQESKFVGTVSITGWGEPLLHPNIVEIVTILKSSSSRIEIQTNGDALTDLVLPQLVDVVDSVIVNAYDDVVWDKFNQNANVRVMDKRSANVAVEMKFNNRAGALVTSHQLPIESPCYMPFYKLAVDYDLTTYLCDYDWAKRTPVGSLLDKPLLELWQSSKLTEYRKKLYCGDRSFVPCSSCDASGTLYGKLQADLMM